MLAPETSTSKRLTMPFPSIPVYTLGACGWLAASRTGMPTVHSEGWDAGAQRCARTDSGSIEVGSSWHNESKYSGSAPK